MNLKKAIFGQFSGCTWVTWTVYSVEKVKYSESPANVRLAVGFWLNPQASKMALVHLGLQINVE